VTRKQTKLRRLAHVAVTLVCAYAVALTVILSGWTTNGAMAAGGFSAICSEHTAGADAPPSGGDNHHHGLCAMLCGWQAGNIDAAAAPSSIVLSRPLLLVAGALSAIEHLDSRSYFPKDHLVRGPPLRIAA
jgi:hypothetical protein